MALRYGARRAAERAPCPEIIQRQLRALPGPPAGGRQWWWLMKGTCGDMLVRHIEGTSGYRKIDAPRNWKF